MFYQFGACIRTADSNASKYWVRFCPCTATVIASIISTLICLPKRISRLAVYYRARESERAHTPRTHRKNEEVKIAEMHRDRGEEEMQTNIYNARIFCVLFSPSLTLALECARFFFFFAAPNSNPLPELRNK